MSQNSEHAANVYQNSLAIVFHGYAALPPETGKPLSPVSLHREEQRATRTPTRPSLESNISTRKYAEILARGHWRMTRALSSTWRRWSTVPLRNPPNICSLGSPFSLFFFSPTDSRSFCIPQRHPRIELYLKTSTLDVDRWTFHSRGRKLLFPRVRHGKSFTPKSSWNTLGQNTELISSLAALRQATQFVFSHFRTFNGGEQVARRSVALWRGASSTRKERNAVLRSQSETGWPTGCLCVSYCPRLLSNWHAVKKGAGETAASGSPWDIKRGS